MRAGQKRTIAQAGEFSGLERAELRKIFREAKESLRFAPTATFERVIREHRARAQSDATPNTTCGRTKPVLKPGQQRTIAEAVDLSGYSRTNLQMIFRDANVSLCFSPKQTFERVLREYCNRIHGNAQPITIDGRTKTIEAWAKDAAINRHVLYRRRARTGATMEDTIRAALARPGHWTSGDWPVAQ